MKNTFKKLLWAKHKKNGEMYVSTLVKIIICVVIGALLLTSVYAVAKSGIESAKNRVNDLLDYNPCGEDGPNGGDTSIPGGGDESEPEEPINPYLTFQSLNPFTISVELPKWNGTMEYSTDTENWTTWDGSEIQSVDGKLYLRGTENTRVSAQSGSNYSPFVISGTAVECVGNIETLLNWQAVVGGQHPTMNSYCFYNAFRDCSALTTAPELPATTLSWACYYEMFWGCTNLTTAPALPATTLANYCYRSMFYGCTSLTTAPALPATTLSCACYYEMFRGCTNLTTVPALPATTLASNCYNHMFFGCANLTKAPTLPATTLAEDCYDSMFYGCTNLKVSATQTGAYQYEWRIPTEGTISSTPLNWSYDMLTNTGGTFTGDPDINTTYYLEYPPVG
jgi:hypothetical protein